jgi:hypothetical protein
MAEPEQMKPEAAPKTEGQMKNKDAPFDDEFATAGIFKTKLLKDADIIEETTEYAEEKIPIPADGKKVNIADKPEDAAKLKKKRTVSDLKKDKVEADQRKTEEDMKKSTVPSVDVEGEFATAGMFKAKPKTNEGKLEKSAEYTEEKIPIPVAAEQKATDSELVKDPAKKGIMAKDEAVSEVEKKQPMSLQQKRLAEQAEKARKLAEEKKLKEDEAERKRAEEAQKRRDESLAKKKAEEDAKMAKDKGKDEIMKKADEGKDDAKRKEREEVLKKRREAEEKAKAEADEAKKVNLKKCLNNFYFYLSPLGNGRNGKEARRCQKEEGGR